MIDWYVRAHNRTIYAMHDEHCIRLHEFGWSASWRACVTLCIHSHAALWKVAREIDWWFVWERSLCVARENWKFTRALSMRCMCGEVCALDMKISRNVSHVSLFIIVNREYTIGGNHEEFEKSGKERGRESERQLAIRKFQTLNFLNQL